MLLKIGLTVHSWQVGQQTGNTAILALAYDHRNDIFSAGAATVGILLGQLGYTFVDPLAGAIVALIILGTGIQIIRESTSELMDTLPVSCSHRADRGRYRGGGSTGPSLWPLPSFFILYCLPSTMASWGQVVIQRWQP